MSWSQARSSFYVLLFASFLRKSFRMDQNGSEWIRMAWPCWNLGKPRGLKRIRSAIGQSSAMDSVPWSFFSDGFRVEKWRVDRCLVYWCLLVVLNVAARFIEIYIFVHTSSHRAVAFLSNSEDWIGREYQRGLGGGISWIDFLKMESNGSDTVKECRRGDEAGQAKANCAVDFPQLLRNLGILWKRTVISNQDLLELLSHHVTSWLRMKIWQEYI